jgi:hypothetical protein
MRIVLIILSLTATAVCLVHIRRADVAVRHEIQCIQSQHVQLRREIWHEKMELGHLLTPEAIRSRVDAMALELTNETPPPRFALGEADAPEMQR